MFSPLGGSAVTNGWLTWVDRPPATRFESSGIIYSTEKPVHIPVNENKKKKKKVKRNRKLDRRGKIYTPVTKS